MTESFQTTYVGLFGLELDEGSVSEVEIPLIQRDYAQGREDARTSLIRQNFLDVLHAAATGGEPVGLDFVYGEVEDGTLRPLDGQQRLTVLFLLHWYVASRMGHIEDAAPWASLSYATRPSARLFCERLAAASLPDHCAPGGWIRDQPWYQWTWRHDPTVQSMLVVLDTIHERFRADDLTDVWARLTDPDTPAISFHVLPIDDMGEAEELYIKMNSRGRPLTEFEDFKAQFERIIEDHERADEFAAKVDGEWSNLLWPIHGGDNLVDDEFLHCLEFVIEICEWRAGRTGSGRQRLVNRAQTVFADDTDADDNLDFLFHAFDTWGDGSGTDAYFDAIFDAGTPEPDGDVRIGIFGTDARANLFEACVRDFGNDARFGISRRMLLYAVLLARMHDTPDVHWRIRSLRNLLEASTDEIRPANMPKIVQDVEALIVDGELDRVGGLNTAQREDEVAKRAVCEANPDLLPVVHRLEEDRQLRGSLVAFDLDPERFKARAEAFQNLRGSDDVVTALTGALLAAGVYHRRLGRTMQFGPPAWSARWRDLLTGTTRDAMGRTREQLMTVLDTIVDSEDEALDALDALTSEFLADAEATERMGWRYYLTKYSEMRTGDSGIYRSIDHTMGYSVCMLRRKQLNSYYWDPFLLAVVRQGGLADAVEGGDGPIHIGYADTPRWLRLKGSSLGLRCIDRGFAVQPPDDVEHRGVFDALVEERDDAEEGDDEWLLSVPQVYVGGERVDTVDRIEIAVDFLKAAVDAGL